MESKVEENFITSTGNILEELRSLKDVICRTLHNLLKMGSVWEFPMNYQLVKKQKQKWNKKPLIYTNIYLIRNYDVFEKTRPLRYLTKS